MRYYVTPLPFELFVSGFFRMATFSEDSLYILFTINVLLKNVLSTILVLITFDLDRK